MSALHQELSKLIAAKPSKTNWLKICKHLDQWPEALLADAFDLIDADPRWHLDVNPKGGWEMPVRYTPTHWAKALLQGRAPSGFPSARQLQYHASKVTDAGLDRILATEALAGITHLYLGSCHLTDAAAHALARHAAALPALTKLVLGDNAIRADGLRALLATPLAGQLVMLQLYSTQIGDGGVDALCATPLPALTHLTLSFSDTTQAALERLLHADTLPALTKLAITADDADDAPAKLKASDVGHAHLRAAILTS